MDDQASSVSRAKLAGFWSARIEHPLESMWVAHSKRATLKPQPQNPKPTIAWWSCSLAGGRFLAASLPVCSSGLGPQSTCHGSPTTLGVARVFHTLGLLGSCGRHRPNVWVVLEYLTPSFGKLWLGTSLGLRSFVLRVCEV